MKKRKFSCEQLSEIYDKVCREASDIKKLYPDMCSESLDEFFQLEKTVNLLKSMKQISIKNADVFCSETLRTIESKKHFRHSIVNRLALPAAAAVVIVAGALSYNVYNIPAGTSSEVGTIASAVEPESSYVIEVDSSKTAAQIRNSVIDHGGVIIEEADGTIKAKARIANYITIKKDLTLSKEDKIFYSRSRNMMLAGSNSNVYTSDYIDQTIEFIITASK